MATLIRHDLEFVLQQIRISEQHAAGGDLRTLVAGGSLNPGSELLPFGLRTVNGTYNNIVPGQEHFGAADQPFPRMLDPNLQSGELFDPDGPGPAPAVPTSYTQTSGIVADSEPRTISNLIVDQTDNNPAAVEAAEANENSVVAVSPGLDGVFGTPDDVEVFHIPNVAPDVGLSAPFNSWMTLFGQFFDHGLDLVNKGGSGTVFIPLKPDDPLYVEGSPTNFMVLTRATNGQIQPGADGVLGTADDIRDHTNQTTPFVDQNQTYTSHASHQVFLREYELNALGRPVATGNLIDGANGGIANWAEVKAQAADMLGIQLTDADVFNVPLLATDEYGQFERGPNGFAQFVTATGLVEADPGANGGLGTLVPSNAFRTGHAFLDDIAHHAAPGTFDPDGPGPATPIQKVADNDILDFNGDGVIDGDDLIDGAGIIQDANGDTIIDLADLADVNLDGMINGNDSFADDRNPTTYDDEMLGKHFVTGDGRGNENIGLTAVHFIFHAEHNRQVEEIKATITATGDTNLIAEWQLEPGVWNGERLFQAARFATEMQYQHLVFEEFARKIQPQVNVFAGYDSEINPAIVAEFAHTVYRFGHSMLTETVDRYDANFNVISADPLHPAQDGSGDQIGLIAAFLNPLAFTASGSTDALAAGSIVRGMTRQVGNEIDEFVTEALRNNLVGLPLDLAAINMARARDTGVPGLNAARREFFEGTGDSQLKPYASWVEFAGNLKHEASAINFIAAYGTHSLITAETTLEGKRAAALAIVTGSAVTLTDGRVIEAPADRVDFLNSVGDWANAANGVTRSGVDDIDLWIGGLAEKVLVFGGMLGSTFNFVFESQMEALQDGDRLYYLTRLAGLNFLTELENNSFSKMVMLNTDVTHLPADIFSTPAYILEVDQTKQFGDDPEGGSPLLPIVVRNNPATAGSDPNYLHYRGEDHVVLGGTEGNDILIAGIGDDTIWGDGGNDRIEGGDGVDNLNGGAGDDIITDLAFDDNIKGEDGNDVINAGNGFDLIIGGPGSDFIVAGEDPDEVFGGTGNDFIRMGDAADTVFGGEGDDWIEGGGQADLLQGDNGEPFQESSIVGNDVIKGDGGNDDYDAESGDDIMITGAGIERNEGMLGFDWVIAKDDTAAGAGQGVDHDMSFTGLLPPTVENNRDRFDSVEGLSGWIFDDVLRGDSLNNAVDGVGGNELTNIALIDGLQALLDDMLDVSVTSINTGNIILGGDGSDVIEGRGGDDLIDGDAWLNVRLTAGGLSYDSMAELQAAAFAGTLNPGQISIVREILYDDADDGTNPVDTNVDTAVFSDVAAAYTITNLGNGEFRVAHTTITAGVPDDGVDIVRNIERLQFANTAVTINGVNVPATGTPTIVGAVQEDQILTATLGTVADGNGIDGSSVQFTWQAEDAPASGIFLDVGSGPTFSLTDLQVGRALRVAISFTDLLGATERIVSAQTAAVANINDVPLGLPAISDTSPTPTVAILASAAGVTDADGLATAVFRYQWQTSPSVGLPVWANVGPLSTSPSFIPGAVLAGQLLRVVVTYTDDHGFSESVASLPTTLVGQLFNGSNAVLDVFTGSVGDDLINGLGAIDVLSGGDGNDRIDGGSAGDTLNGGNGDDTLIGGADNGVDFLNGDAGADTLQGGGGNDQLNGGTGADVMIGGAGNDGYFVDNAQDLVTELASQGTDTISTTLSSFTLPANVENLIFTGTGPFNGIGNAGANNITGQAGDDSLDGGLGIDNLTGNAGNDTYFVDVAGDDVIELAGGGTDTIISTSNSFNMDVNVENFRQIGSNATIVAGNGSSNVITGNIGNDTLSGGAGLDTLRGDAGADTLNGGGDADTLIGESGADTLNGDGGTDTLIGGAGNDTMNGGAGNDTFVFGAGFGNDTIAAGFDANATGGQDLLDISGFGIAAGDFAAAVTITTAAIDLVAGLDTLVTIGADTIVLSGVTGVGTNAITQADFIL